MTQLIDVHPKSEWAGDVKFEIGDDDIVLVVSTVGHIPWLITYEYRDDFKWENLSTGQYEGTALIKFYTAAHHDGTFPKIIGKEGIRESWFAIKDDWRTFAESLLRELDKLEEGS